MQCLKAVRYFNTLKYCTTKCTLLQTTTRDSARQASNYKRQQTNIFPREQLDALKSNPLLQQNELTAQEWQEVRKTLINNYKHISANNVDAVIVGICNEATKLPLAKNYVQDLRDNGVEPNIATLGRLLRVYSAAYHAKGCTPTALTATEQNEVLEIYAALRKTHEVLDFTTCENLIYGLVATTRWSDAIELLDMIKLTTTPSVGAYTELVVKAFSMNEMQLGWRLLEDMLAQRKMPRCEIFETYLNEIAKNETDFKQEFEKILHFLEKHELAITQKVADTIVTLAKRKPQALTVEIVRISRYGKCKHCQNFMQNISISDEEYAQLRDSFMQKVLIRKDVFQKSTAEEVERFKDFVARTAPYDCVIDGLNVAYSMGVRQPPHMLANLLAAVVRYFSSKNKHVLVLGRRHMNNWPQEAMQFVRKNASIFLTNNLSQDDPFLLYATLTSGQMTDFFSRDLMRTHAFLLGPELKSIFRRWQQEHQYSLITQTESGKIIVKEPTKHMLSTHKVQNHWHIPCTPEYTPNPPETFEKPDHWLCVKIQK